MQIRACKEIGNRTSGHSTIPQQNLLVTQTEYFSIWVGIDSEYSNFPVVESVPSTSARTLILGHGLPKMLKIVPVCAERTTADRIEPSGASQSFSLHI